MCDLSFKDECPELRKNKTSQSQHTLSLCLKTAWKIFFFLQNTGIKPVKFCLTFQKVTDLKFKVMKL